MDQQTLGCKYPIIHAPDLDCSSSMNSANSGNTASMLRSHSDSRIHIPHFLSVKDKDFHTNLSSLFENVAGFNGAGQQHSLNDTMDNSSGVERKLSLTKPGLDRNKSAFELCSKNTVNEEPTSALRKTSSVANYNIEDHSSIPRQGSSSFLSSAFHFVTGNNSSLAIQKIPEEEDGGLKMMVTGSSFSPSALTSSGSLHVDPIVHNNPTHLSGNNLADIDALTEKNKPRTNGMFGIFNRGFLGKQVMSDQESQYRYIFGVEKY